MTELIEAIVKALAREHAFDLGKTGQALRVDCHPCSQLGALLVVVKDGARRFTVGRTIPGDGQPAAGFRVIYSPAWLPLEAIDDKGDRLTGDNLVAANIQMVGLVRSYLGRSGSRTVSVETEAGDGNLTRTP